MKQLNANKPHIAVFGRCNCGKSTLVNTLAGEQLSIVSSSSGTTTDPVKRSFEIEGFAPVVFFDTAGVDDTSALGELRVKKSYETIELIDFAIVLFSHNSFGEWEKRVIEKLDSKGIEYIIIHNNFPEAKFDFETCTVTDKLITEFNLDDNSSRHEILKVIKYSLPEWSYSQVSMFDDRVVANDFVLLVVPIDISAPEGRLILPQVQAVRNLLDKNAISIVVQPPQIAEILKQGLKLKMVVTDSQVLKEVKDIFTDEKTPITTFSILLASSKGNPEIYNEGLKAVDNLKDGDKILIVENCLHQTSCEDIGRVKIPKWLENYTNKKFDFTFISGLNLLPENLSEYAFAVQCGGCMVTRRQLHNRINRIKNAGVPITNYGMLIKKIR